MGVINYLFLQYNKFKPMSVKEKSQEFVDTITLELDQKDLILYNDEHNTFEHVISCLQNYCNHSSIQAEPVSYTHLTLPTICSV